MNFCYTDKMIQDADLNALIDLTKSDCADCRLRACVEIGRREMVEIFNAPYGVLFGAKEMKDDDAKMPRGQGQLVNADPKASTTGSLGFSSEDNVPWIRVRTSRDLSFLIRDKSGESTPVVVKDVDSKTLHDMLDIADEIVISRVDAK